MSDKTMGERSNGLPLINSVADTVEAHLKSRGEVGFLYFAPKNLKETQKKYGRSRWEKVVRALGRTLKNQQGKLYRQEDLVVRGGMDGEYFAVFLFSPPRYQTNFGSQGLKLISYRILQALQEVLNQQNALLGIQEKIKFLAGYSFILPNPKRNIQELINEAEKDSAFRAELEEMMVEFISEIAHELRTPLTCIKGYAENLLEGEIEDKTLSRKWVSIIAEESFRLERFIQDLIDLSLIEAKRVELKFSPLEIGKLVKNTAALLYPLAQRSQVKLIVEVPRNLPKVMGDANRIYEVFTNLVENAVKYSREGGKVKIQVKKKSEAELEIRVVDYGEGIPPEDQEMIFERFYRGGKAKSDFYKGSGLGLAISKQIVEAHGGSIKVRSPRGKGATFIVTLPVGELWEEPEKA